MGGGGVGVGERIFFNKRSFFVKETFSLPPPPPSLPHFLSANHAHVDLMINVSSDKPAEIHMFDYGIVVLKISLKSHTISKFEIELIFKFIIFCKYSSK